MDTDQRYLYGVVALQAALIDSGRFTEFINASLEWEPRSDTSFLDHIIEHHWIQPADRDLLDQLVERKLRAHAGDA